jgi:hypothetical protein
MSQGPAVGGGELLDPELLDPEPLELERLLELVDPEPLPDPELVDIEPVDPELLPLSSRMVPVIVGLVLCGVTAIVDPDAQYE